MANISEVRFYVHGTPEQAKALSRAITDFINDSARQGVLIDAQQLLLAAQRLKSPVVRGMLRMAKR